MNFEFKSITKISDTDSVLELVKISSGSHVCASDCLKEKGFAEFKNEDGNPRFYKNGEVFKYNHPIWDIKNKKVLLRKIN
jgi:hypothetical protein